MDLELVSTDPDPYEPYRISQAMRVGDLLFVSGQAAIGRDGQLVGIGDFDAADLMAFPGSSNTWNGNNRCHTEAGVVPPTVCNPGE